jgi:hypothetical protein
MTRTQHQLHPTKSFPVYCLDWTDDTTLLLGGGGGATKSGIGNKLVRRVATHADPRNSSTCPATGAASRTCTSSA